MCYKIGDKSDSGQPHESETTDETNTGVGNRPFHCGDGKRCASGFDELAASQETAGSIRRARRACRADRRGFLRAAHGPSRIRRVPRPGPGHRPRRRWQNTGRAPVGRALRNGHRRSPHRPAPAVRGQHRKPAGRRRPRPGAHDGGHARASAGRGGDDRRQEDRQAAPGNNRQVDALPPRPGQQRRGRRHRDRPAASPSMAGRASMDADAPPAQQRFVGGHRGRQAVRDRRRGDRRGHDRPVEVVDHRLRRVQRHQAVEQADRLVGQHQRAVPLGPGPGHPTARHGRQARLRPAGAQRAGVRDRRSHGRNRRDIPGHQQRRGDHPDRQGPAGAGGRPDRRAGSRRRQGARHQAAEQEGSRRDRRRDGQDDVEMGGRRRGAHAGDARRRRRTGLHPVRRQRDVLRSPDRRRPMAVR